MRRHNLLVALLGGVLTLAPALSQQDTGTAGLRHARLYWIGSSRLLDQVNHNDARAALKVWFDVMAQERGFILDSRIDVVEGVQEIRDRLQSHSVDLLALDLKTYMELESSHLVVPILTPARGRQGSALYSYLLLVGPASETTTISTLRGKHILVSSGNASNTGLAWLEVLLGKERLGRAASFFAAVKVADKPQACILPLFFGSVDACVVDEISLNLAKEMNPQVGKLKVLARSGPLIEGLIAMPAQQFPYLKELLDSMLSLHQTPRGRQLLTVFRTDRLVPVQPGDLDSARDLWRDNSRLIAPAPNRMPGSERGKERY